MPVVTVWAPNDVRISCHVREGQETACCRVSMDRRAEAVVEAAGRAPARIVVRDLMEAQS